MQTFLLFYKTSYLNEEVNCSELSPSVSVPWFDQPTSMTEGYDADWKVIQEENEEENH
jgi:hypothetical protein